MQEKLEIVLNNYLASFNLRLFITKLIIPLVLLYVNRFLIINFQSIFLGVWSKDLDLYLSNSTIGNFIAIGPDR